LPECPAVGFECNPDFFANRSVQLNQDYQYNSLAVNVWVETLVALLGLIALHLALRRVGREVGRGLVKGVFAIIREPLRKLLTVSYRRKVIRQMQEERRKQEKVRLPTYGALHIPQNVRSNPTAADCRFVFCLLKTREERKASRVRHELEVNMRESEREQLARRDAYERALERRAKRRKQG
jgi:hypothetical protein